MMKEKKLNEGIEGVLLLLLCLVLSYFLCHAVFSGTAIFAQNHRKIYPVCQTELTAFQKITLGMPVSINSEDAEALAAVPGIGPKTAGLIVREREKKGGFKGLDEIKSVRGIGSALYEKIRPYLAL